RSCIPNSQRRTKRRVAVAQFLQTDPSHFQSSTHSCAPASRRHQKQEWPEFLRVAGETSRSDVSRALSGVPRESEFLERLQAGGPPNHFHRGDRQAACPPSLPQHVYRNARLCRAPIPRRLFLKYRERRIAR